jgi:hypothetical protein
MFSLSRPLNEERRKPATVAMQVELPKPPEDNLMQIEISSSTTRADTVHRDNDCSIATIPCDENCSYVLAENYTDPVTGLFLPIYSEFINPDSGAKYWMAGAIQKACAKTCSVLYSDGKLLKRTPKSEIFHRIINAK